MTMSPPPTRFDAGIPANAEFAQSILTGLSAPQKRIDSKWLYDAYGSQLFDTITELEEYYPTRTELGILRQNVARLQEFAIEGSTLVELGSGSSTKTRALLNVLTGLHSYVPIDISREHLLDAAHHVTNEYPRLNVTPIIGDFTAEITLPTQLSNAPKILFFPGSTIGNFEIDGAARLLGRMRKMPNVTAFVVGVDLVKDTETLVRAYDDSKGVTAAFNLNLLTRINRELEADFDLDSFSHAARWNFEHSRIEMHLVSKVAQEVHLLGNVIRFAADETIHTENSHKYTPELLERTARQEGWSVSQIWTDTDMLFGVAVLTPISD